MLKLIKRFLSYPPHLVVKMPALSPTMTQGNIGSWKKQLGDSVSSGDLLVEIETDKAQMDLECQEEGFLAKIIVKENTSDVKVGQAICVLAENEQDVSKFADFSIDSAPVATRVEEKPAEPIKPTKVESKVEKSSAKTTQPIDSGSRINASPLAKALALEKGISLLNIKGSGPGGRIIQKDVLNAKPVANGPLTSNGKVDSAPLYQDVKLSTVRQVIATRMVQSTTQIPHYYETCELDMSKVLKLRQALNKESLGKFKLSVNDFVVKACGLALKQVPQCNSSWVETENGHVIRMWKSSDISVAVATENGLITPIIRDCDKLGLEAISNNVKILADKAKNNKLQPHEYQGGSFTVSNLGMFGIDSFTAIINQPQSCILAVGSITDKLVLDKSSQGNNVKEIQVMKVTMSSDHRVVDGAVAAKFLSAFRALMEDPLRMML